MTAKREIPLPGDTLAWVHSEVSEIKSRLALIAQSAEQSRALATGAAESAHQARGLISQFDGVGPALLHVQDDLRALREHLARAQDDINALRQGRDEAARRALEESEIIRQDRNASGRRFSELERAVETWHERQAQAEEHYRRNMEMISQVAMRIEPLEQALSETDTSQSRIFTAISRIDHELQRLSSAILLLQNEDATQRERVGSNADAIRRVEGEVEALRVETNKISRIDDRLELVQAERTRHNERLNDVSAELERVDDRLNAHEERTALIEARMSGYQDDLRKLRERLQYEREQLAAYLSHLRDLETDFRKREIIAIEKEIKDIRGRAFDIQPE